MRLSSLPEIYDIVNGRDLVTAGQSLTVRNVSKLMSANEIGAVIVCDDRGDIVGIFTERDLMNRVVAADRDPDATVVGDVMTPNPETVDLEQTLEAAVARMIQLRFRHLPVVQSIDGSVDKTLVGIISARDLLAVLNDQARGDQGQGDRAQGDQTPGNPTESDQPS